MTSFKNYSYLIVNRKVLKPSIFGLENSCLKAAFCSRVLSFTCLEKFLHWKYLIFSKNTIQILTLLRYSAHYMYVLQNN